MGIVHGMGIVHVCAKGSCVCVCVCDASRGENPHQENGLTLGEYGDSWKSKRVQKLAIRTHENNVNLIIREAGMGNWFAETRRGSVARFPLEACMPSPPPERLLHCFDVWLGMYECARCGLLPSCTKGVREQHTNPFPIFQHSG